MAEPIGCATAIMTPQNAVSETGRLIAEALYPRRPDYMAIPSDVANSLLLRGAPSVSSGAGSRVAGGDRRRVRRADQQRSGMCATQGCCSLDAARPFHRDVGGEAPGSPPTDAGPNGPSPPTAGSLPVTSASLMRMAGPSPGWRLLGLGTAAPPNETAQPCRAAPRECCALLVHWLAQHWVRRAHRWRAPCAVENFSPWCVKAALVAPR
jgi:hypothetical protein